MTQQERDERARTYVHGTLAQHASLLLIESLHQAGCTAEELANAAVMIREEDIAGLQAMQLPTHAPDEAPCSVWTVYVAGWNAIAVEWKAERMAEANAVRH